MTRRRRVTLSLALGVGLVAMHCLALLMPAAGVMPMAAANPMPVLHASGAAHGIAGSHRLTMTSCAGHACLAARGAESASPMATPSDAGGVVVAVPAWVTPGRPSADLLGTPRPPPRSGPCSPLCVWRV